MIPFEPIIALSPGEIALMIPIMGLSIPLMAIWTSHKRKIEEIKARAQGQMNEQVRAELQKMQEQIESLRSTSTKFDMSFDAALERLEQRMDRVEERQSIRGAASAESSEPQQQQYVGGGR